MTIPFSLLIVLFVVVFIGGYGLGRIHEAASRVYRQRQSLAVFRAEMQRELGDNE